MSVSPRIMDGHIWWSCKHSYDAKNLVKTARTIHLLEEKEAIHMFFMFRKEACSGSIHDLALFHLKIVWQIAWRSHRRKQTFWSQRKVLLTTKVKRLREPCSLQPWQKFHSFTKCFVSCQFLRGLWMDLSGEIADIHMRTYANNLVTTARTIHLLEQKETIHMMSVLRKEACSESIHDLAYIPTQNCLADCLTKASAKAENLSTAMKTGRLSDVDIHHNFRTIMEHKAFLSTWCKTFMHTRERNVLFLNALKISLFFSHQFYEKNHPMWCLWELPWILRVKILRK